MARRTKMMDFAETDIQDAEERFEAPPAFEVGMDAEYIDRALSALDDHRENQRAARIDAGRPVMNLNKDQEKARREIARAYLEGKNFYLLTGNAGTGKTTLMQEVILDLQFLGAKPAATAPTHKAVQVLRGKMKDAEIDVDCVTIHSFLGLRPTASDTEKTVLRRNDRYKAPSNKSLVIDECSMIGTDLQNFISEDLEWHFVLYVGDPAQLPPVGEPIALIMGLLMGKDGHHSHLVEIVRQAQGNPILQVAQNLRDQQDMAKPLVSSGGSFNINWKWCRDAVGGEGSEGLGIYMAGIDADIWMRDAFTSDEFAADNDAFRYIAYTNNRVKEVNAKVRYWLYGPTDTPFVPGERVICRNPILDENQKPVFSTNEEAIVTAIHRDMLKLDFGTAYPGPKKREIPAWSYDLPVWKVTLRRNEAAEFVEPMNWQDYPEDSKARILEAFEANRLTVTCNMPVNERQAYTIDRRLVTEAQANHSRWRDRFDLKDKIADLRSVYAMTAHTSQGSTFGTAFIDVADIAMRERADPVECLKLLYVGVTRPRFSVILVNC